MVEQQARAEVKGENEMMNKHRWVDAANVEN